MDIFNDFSDWLCANTSLATKSIEAYARSVKNTSEDMLNKGIISKSLFDMTKLELDVAIKEIFNNPDFIIKNNKHDRTHSNGLKHFRRYRNINNDSYITIENLINRIDNYESLHETERTSIVQSRIGQGIFRKRILKKYNNTCIVTGINETNLLIASHVKPWAVCTNQERLSSENGLLLSPTYDKLFDAGFITFSKQGEILFSNHLKQETIEKLKSAKNVFDLKITPELTKNLQYHRDYIYVTSRKKNT